MPTAHPDGLSQSRDNAQSHLLSERNTHGHWEGELSSSALSTATAITALFLVDSNSHRSAIDTGLRWLADHQNDDGGWGDTSISFSNISTTLLVWSAFGLAGNSPELKKNTNAAENWVRGYVGSLEPDAIAEKVKARYGRDRTFSVPILMACAIGNRLGDDRKKAWKRVMALPFELAAFPRNWFAALRLPVVSYALPALIAIGFARYYHAPPVPPVRWWRRAAWKKASRLLAEIQPPNGGFLEATPLTSFVSMALASAGQKDHPVVRKGVEFLLSSVRPDGSWPIDTNLATWGTTLSVKALYAGGESALDSKDAGAVRDWLLGQHYTETHPYTNAPPGGWAWTDLPGGVPDADDTPGAMLALRHLRDSSSREACLRAAILGALWLARVQNRNGGIPTFCRGWGKLPFDRSSPDLTAHTLRAWDAWRDDFDPGTIEKLKKPTANALRFLAECQDEDGAWTPLWFGNQHVPGETNRTYGTAHVLVALAGHPDKDTNKHDLPSMCSRAAGWLSEAQNADGGWGGDTKVEPSSLEETALAVEALSTFVLANPPTGTDHLVAAIRNGTEFLISHTGGGNEFPVAPIGFYFAKLWYHERLYPVVWTLSALNHAGRVFQR